MQRDIDYVVRDGEVIIVDEFHRRLMYGNATTKVCTRPLKRKEGVKIARESKKRLPSRSRISSAFTINSPA